MSHHSHLPPEVDEAVRSFIRRHKHGLRWGCLVAALTALALGLLATWALFRGALRVKDWVASNAPAIRLPLEWEKPMGEAALAQLRLQTRFTSDRQVLDPLNRLAAPILLGRIQRPAGWPGNDHRAAVKIAALDPEHRDNER